MSPLKALLLRNPLAGGSLLALVCSAAFPQPSADFPLARRKPLASRSSS